jgi:hypothetical protein
MLKVQETGNNTTIPSHVRGIAAAIIEEAKAYPKGNLSVNHRHDFKVTEFMFSESIGQNPMHARLSHTIYPEETLVVSFEDQRNPKVVPPNDKIKGDTALTSYDTVTRHYQPKQYLGETAGVPNSGAYATGVSRKDEANIATDIFNFIRQGVVPA